MKADLVWKFGEFMESMLSLLDDEGIIGDMSLSDLVNMGVVVLGGLGFLFWMSKQAKFNKEAEANPDQIK